jgi:hypothetical protein
MRHQFAGMVTDSSKSRCHSVVSAGPSGGITIGRAGDLIDPHPTSHLRRDRGIRRAP